MIQQYIFKKNSVKFEKNRLNEYYLPSTCKSGHSMVWLYIQNQTKIIKLTGLRPSAIQANFPDLYLFGKSFITATSLLFNK